MSFLSSLENRMLTKPKWTLRFGLTLGLASGLALASLPLQAQTASLGTNDEAARLTLKQAFDAAWARQPEGLSLDTRQTAASARQRQAAAWTAEPPSLELSAKTDQVARNEGSREYALGVTVPLWLPGERAASGALAQAEARAVESRAASARLHVAAAVRDAWWNWQRLLGEQALAQSRLENARQLAKDVRLRVKAGDLALADQYQAEGAVAAAEAALAESDSHLATATRQLQALTGLLPQQATDRPEAIPADFAAGSSAPDEHPALRSLSDQTETARRLADLARAQTRGNPELVLAVSRERESFEGRWQRMATLGVRIPLGSDARHQAKLKQAEAEAIEAESQLQLERDRLINDLEASRTRLESLRLQLAAAEKRAQLARETRGFFAKSFRLGETDLPTRLRIELETVEAERLASRARIDCAAAISALRQVMGLLPEADTAF
jgi:cobalt-zinc-cadmium efflux system outer membrane protein